MQRHAGLLQAGCGISGEGALLRHGQRAGWLRGQGGTAVGLPDAGAEAARILECFKLYRDTFRTFQQVTLLCLGLCWEAGSSEDTVRLVHVLEKTR